MTKSEIELLDRAGVKIFGDLSYRGKCCVESAEQSAFFSHLRRQYGRTWGALALHPRNEGLIRGAQFATIARAKSEGMTKGAADIIIPGKVSFVCEMKRRDLTKSAFQSGQIDYLIAAKNAGAFSCLALGYDAAWQALQEWIAGHEKA